MATKGVKRITVDELARMTQDGFKHMESSFKGELKEVRNDFREHAQVVVEEFRRINADIKDIKVALLPIAGIIAKHDKQIDGLESRVSHIEPKVGIVRLRR